MPRKSVTRLYGNDGVPERHFNKNVLAWLNGTLRLREHRPLAAFEPMREKCNLLVNTMIDDGLPKSRAYKRLLSGLTGIMLNVDLSSFLGNRLSRNLINESGFRTTLSQGIAKNNGENFVNASVLALSSLLQGQDRILVDKGTPPPLRDALRLTRTVDFPSGSRDLHIPIECDFAVFDRCNPTKAIICSAKTRLKEVFHIGTMWKLFFDMIGDLYCQSKWGVTAPIPVPDVHYVFATADMIPAGGKRTQGGDVERAEPRNLIAVDASFFDYVFVSKSGIGHVSAVLNTARPREALFHEFSCIVDLMSQKFDLTLS